MLPDLQHSPPQRAQHMPTAGKVTVKRGAGGGALGKTGRRTPAMEGCYAAAGFFMIAPMIAPATTYHRMP